MKLLPAAAAMAIGLSGGATAQEPGAEPQILGCKDFSKTTDEAALVKRFGRENVAAAKLDGAEGETIRGTLIFPKDAKRRIEIYWSKEAKRRGLTAIAVKGQSEWLVRTPGNARPTVGLRTSLDDLEEANERPFTISGFGWDYGGYSTGWKGGKLDHMDGGCGFSARFNPDPKAKEKALDKASGDKEFSSSDPALRAVAPRLSSITLGWPE